MPSCSAEGKSIAFVIRLMTLGFNRLPQVGSPTRIITSTAGDRLPAVSPDGTKKIAFFSDRSGNREVWRMKADGVDLVNVTNTPAADEFSTSWQPLP